MIEYEILKNGTEEMPFLIECPQCHNERTRLYCTKDYFTPIKNFNILTCFICGCVFKITHVEVK